MVGSMFGLATFWYIGEVEVYMGDIMAMGFCIIIGDKLAMARVGLGMGGL